MFNWFEFSFSRLAKIVSRDGEDLQKAYQIISTEIHGIWTLSGISISGEGIIDFRGYPDQKTRLLRAVELLFQVLVQYMNLWNEIAESVGAEKVYFIDRQNL